MKIQKKKIFFFLGGVWVGLGGGGGGQGGCESRIEVFWKIQKKNWGGGGGRVGQDGCERRIEVFVIIQEKNFLGGGGGVSGGSGRVGGSEWM